MSIMSPEAFQAWSDRDDRAEVVVLIASRAAARVLPIVAGIRPVFMLSQKEGFAVRDVFRNCSVGLAALLFRGSPEGESLVGAISRSRNRYPQEAVSPSVASSNVLHATLQVIGLSAALTGPERARLPHAARCTIARASEALGGSGAVWDATAQDVADIELGLQLRDFETAPLWKTPVPDSITTAWKALKRALVYADPSLQEWVDWYEAVRDGRSRSMHWSVDAEGVFTATPRPAGAVENFDQCRPVILPRSDDTIWHAMLQETL